jgi:hypothetical protein
VKFSSSMNAEHTASRGAKPLAATSASGSGRLCALIGFALAPGCAETPLDATLLEHQVEPGAVPTSSICPVNTPSEDEVYHIVSKATGTCLSSGNVTPIQGAATGVTGFTIELLVCRNVAEQRWTLISTDDSSLVTSFQIRNEELGLNLDLERGNVYDGTRALLYAPHAMDNQLFWFNPSDGSDFEIRALATQSSCLEHMLDNSNNRAVELHGCSPTASIPTQLWLLSPEDCEED